VKGVVNLVEIAVALLLAALHHNPVLRAFCQRLCIAGKLLKVALSVCMHKALDFPQPNAQTSAAMEPESCPDGLGIRLTFKTVAFVRLHDGRLPACRRAFRGFETTVSNLMARFDFGNRLALVRYLIDMVAESAPPKGLRVLGCRPGVWRYTYVSKMINSAADLKGMKL
jgi:hypothetical protein